MTDADCYHANGYVALPGLFSVDVLHAFYARMQADLKAGGVAMRQFNAKGPLLRRDAIEIYAHVYPPMLTFLWGLTPRLEQVVGCPLLPTYAYFRLYQQGDICRVHSDRRACEHSLSLTIAYADDQPWALSVATDRTDTPQPIVAEDFGDQRFGSVPMAPGDGVAYQGTHHRHGRVEPNPNRWSAHLFLHWVEREGRYREEAFDRPTIARNAAGR